LWMLKRMYHWKRHYGASGAVGTKLTAGSEHQEPDVEYDGKQGEKKEEEKDDKLG